MDRLHVACGQFVASPGDKAANVTRMLEYAALARGRGCDLILFPELALTGYLHPDQIPPLVERVTGPNVQRLIEGARYLDISVAFGLAELGEGEVCYNSMLVADRGGRIAAVYRKIHLWDTEAIWARPGSEVTAFDLDGVRCSAWICYDTRFPELGRLAARGGADLALVSTAWLGPADEWALALRARALDNSMFVVGADIISPEPELRCVGASLIAGPRGEVLAQAEPDVEGIIDAVLSGEDLTRQRNRLRLLQNCRLDVAWARQTR